MNNIQQSFANHSKRDPWFHFVIVPLFIVILVSGISGIIFVHRDLHFHILLVLLGAGILLVVFRARIYSLKVQDRVIRLEERLRLAALLPEALKPRIPELTEAQLIALRFASDAELPLLTEKTLNAKLEPKAIKALIQNWRPDHFRV
ncbi:MAG TPA: DUF6526 family protein [Acidisarcina sp.]